MTDLPDHLRPFNLGPLDDTRLAADVQAAAPEANAAVWRERWRADLKRRVAERIARQRAGGT